MARYRPQDKQFMMLRLSVGETIEEATDTEAGQFIKAAFHYERTGEVPEIEERVAKMAFNFIKPDFSWSQAQFEKTCEENKAKRAIGIKKAEKRKQIGEFLEEHSINSFAAYCNEDPDELERKLTTGIKALSLSDLENYLYMAEELEEDEAAAAEDSELNINFEIMQENEKQ